MTKLLHLRNSTPGLAPAADNLTAGQLAINYADGTLWTLNSSGIVKELASASILATTLTTTVASTYGITGVGATITNLDTSFSTGFYYAPSTASGTFPTNTGALNATLLVTNNGTTSAVTQLFTALGGTFDGSIYVRQYVSGAWSIWVAAYTPLNTTTQLVKTINGVSPNTSGNFIVNEPKNKIINGRFIVWQRSVPAAGAQAGFIADRWYMFSNGSTVSTGSATTFPVGSSTYFVWQETAGTGTPYISQSVNDVTTYSGQTATISFWANPSKAMTLTPTSYQNFGTSGSTTVTTAGSAITLTSGAWTLYTQTINVPSVQGKTIGANNYCRIQLATALTPGTFTLNLTEVQWELGPSYTGYEYEDLSITTARCLFYYEMFNNNSLGWAGRLSDGDAAQMMVNYAFKRLGAPTLNFLNVTETNLTNTTITTTEQSNQVSRLTLPTCNQLLGALCTINFNLEVVAELPTT